ncbi:hypothetical protein A3H16_00055 [Candidatus Kaiserbacteria bacterium RIFCSPLOWO2_12_FULL_53_8]|uniref:Penicillin-binding protein transpeptidase domain-containing protein n=1 Tax=Candidatus Kaiserbacteria bacterium RIFCSPLOWO2_12_FULL_53_8 TaxID=1798529 RepID=A0A1F6G2E4_9BACT|nr:MAG: hypothetical protein A3H16_00055 [Candidatus Kaiserbacteria bacterium RIFCSPLOWO2_12_FULL_53_8]
MRSRFILRTRILAGCFVLVALLLLGRLYFVQIVHGAQYQRDATAQYVEPGQDTESRGSIFFTAKDGELVAAAVMQTGYKIAIVPSEITDSLRTFDLINAALPIDRERYLKSVMKKDDSWEEIAFRVSDDAAAKIRVHKLPGVRLVQDQWRFYPAHELAAQAIGFVGFKGDTKTGVYGLEKSWQDTLAQTSSGRYVNPFAEIFTNLQAAVSSDPASHEGSIITSIEPQVQSQLETTLESVMKTYTPRFAGGSVMYPHTGEIVAMATRPGFDPNTYNTVTDQSVFSNSLVEGRYELGSIMKPLTMAAGIDSGAITARSVYDDTGCITVSTYKICNFDLKARGVIPMQEVLSQSLNLGAAFVATKTGYPTFTKYMKAYGFGQKTGIDLPNEVTGDLSPLGNGQKPAINYDTAAFGQGVSVSPIEMIRALGALANQGVLPNPHVVTAIKYASGITRSIDPGQGPRVLAATTSETVTNMLIKVFDEGLLGGELKMEHYSFAAKTGTAQIPMPGGGYYPGEQYLHSFFGYFPAHDPKFIVFLYAFRPQGQKYASATLAHPFMDIAKYLINYYNIPPDR